MRSGRTPEQLKNHIRSHVIVDDETGCWNWGGYITPKGYGRVSMAGAAVPAHRAAYRVFVGEVPDGLQLDHRCRNRRCVNPAHLEPVTARENTHRGLGLAAIHGAKDECIRGHPFDDANTYRTPAGARACRACNRMHSARVRQRGNNAETFQ